MHGRKRSCTRIKRLSPGTHYTEEPTSAENLGKQLSLDQRLFLRVSHPACGTCVCVETEFIVTEVQATHDYMTW